MTTVTALVVIGGTVTERPYTAERITFQHDRETGFLQLWLWRGGKVAEDVTWRRAETVHRVHEPGAEPEPVPFPTEGCCMASAHRSGWASGYWARTEEREDA